MQTAREQTARLMDLLRNEHHALAEFLLALAAFDAARGWVELGYRSLFYFLVGELKLSAGAACYRKAAAELIQRFPEVVEPLRDGRLCFTSVIELSKSLTPENRETVLPRFFHVSKREAKAITAELQPVLEPPTRTVVTALAAPASASPSAPASSLPLLEAALHPDEVDRPVQAAPPAVRPPRTEVEPLTAERSRLHVTVSRRLLEKLSAARDALSHSHPGASEETILEVGLDLILERYAKRRGIGAKRRANAPAKEAAVISAPPPRTARSRHVPAAVARAVWERDRGCCAWPLENGGVCGSTYQVELDHEDGWALGAGTTVEECRLLCKFHQDVSARRLYGDDLMNTYTKPKGPTCSEPVAEYGAATLPRSSAHALHGGRAGPRGFGSTTRPRFGRPAPSLLRCPVRLRGRCTGARARLGPGREDRLVSTKHASRASRCDES